LVGQKKNRKENNGRERIEEKRIIGKGNEVSPSK